MTKFWGQMSWLILGTVLVTTSPIQSAETSAALSVSTPVSRQVFQRDANDQAEIRFHGMVDGDVDLLEAKAELAPGATRGTGTDWVAIAQQDDITDGAFTGELTLNAGGWYQITVRAKNGGQVVAEATIERVGVGDIFVTAGQSNSANFGQPRQKAADERVVYYDGTSFVPAADPIPGGCGSGGSPWPLLGDRIAQSQGVPVCFRSASLTWTEVKNWLPPDTKLYQNLVKCVDEFGPHGVRAVLWHQGESDSLAKTPAGTYCDRLTSIIETLQQDCGYPLPWFVAQASFHPGSQEPEEQEIARGQQKLWEKKVAFRGAVTDDLLGKEYRFDGVHFNQAGLDAHAARWFDALKTQYGWKVD